MPSIDVAHCKKQFEQELQHINNFMGEAKSFKIEVNSGIYRSLSIRTFEMITGLQFLRMHLAWEEFLESVFIRYMCGCSSPSGISPTLLKTKERCVADATRTLFGTSRFLSWAPRETIDRANVYLDKGEPFSTAIGSAGHSLECIYVIRNRFAHRSEYAKERFKEVVRWELGYNPPGMTPGRFLLTEKTLGRGVRKTYFQYYSEILLILSSGVVP